MYLDCVLRQSALSAALPPTCQEAVLIFIHRGNEYSSAFSRFRAICLVANIFFPQPFLAFVANNPQPTQPALQGVFFFFLLIVSG